MKKELTQQCLVLPGSYHHRSIKLVFYGNSQTIPYNLKAHKLQLVLGNTGPIHEREINPLLKQSDNCYDFSSSKFT